MTPIPQDRWRQLENLFHEALNLGPEERAVFLERACPADPALRRQVESLILSSGKIDTLIGGAIEEAAEAASHCGEPKAGDSVGVYRVVREIGQGGMGAVYLAVRDDDEYRKEVAIKLVRSGMVSEEILRRFRSERQILANLDHPNIARLLDGGTTSTGQPYVVMEFIEGIPIDQYCDRDSLTTSERLALFRKVCSAVEYAHANLIVHRDLKPSNILVTAAGEPKLLDFGIAKLLKPVDGIHTAAETRAEQRLMTPDYASPEQVRGENITVASDVYSLGVVLFELLTSQRPYKFQTGLPGEVQRIVCEQPPGRPSAVITSDVVSLRQVPSVGKLRRQLAGDLDNIVLMALRKEPDRRYSSVAQLSDDIRRHLDGLPVAAREDTLAYRTQKFFGRHRAGVLTAAATFVIIALLIAYYTHSLARERDRARLEAAKSAQVSEFLTGLFDISDPSESKGETITARQILGAGAARINSQLSGQPEVRAAMLNVIGRVYLSLGLYKEGEQLLTESVRLYRQKPETLELGSALSNLGESLGAQQKFKEAKPFIEESLAIRRKLLGENSLDVANSLSQLGSLADSNRDFAASSALHQQALAIRRKLVPEVHPAIADSLSRLASLAGQQGSLPQMEEYLRRELEIRERLGAVGDSTYFELAHSLERQARYAEALQFAQRALALSRKLYPADHPRITLNLERVGTILYRDGNHAAAEPYLREAVAIKTRRDGPDSVEHAGAVNLLANVVSARENYSEAEKLYRGVLTIFRRKLGAESFRVTNVQFNLAAVLYLKGDYRAAEQSFREILARDLRTYDSSHPDIALDKYNLARALRRQGKSVESEQLFREALDIQRGKLRPGHPHTANTILNYAYLLNDRGNAQAAEPLLREGIEMRRQGPSKERWQLAEAEIELGRCLTKLKRFQEAESLLSAGYTFFKTNKGENHRYTLLARGYLRELALARRKSILTR